MAINQQLLLSSFEAIKPVADRVVEHFYGVLFKDYPMARKMFDSSKMQLQHKALIGSLVTIFEKFEKPEELKSYLGELGSRHEKYGVKEVHYSWVAKSLLKTLEYFFDDTWSEELRSSWDEALGVIATQMIAKEKVTPITKQEVVAMEKLSITQQLEATLKQLMLSSLTGAFEDKDIVKLAKDKARVLLEEALEQELNALRQQYKQKKSA